MDIKCTLGENIKIDKKIFTKMNFIFNAINDGWTVSKKKDKYIFTQSHGGRKEVFTESYLADFIKTNLVLNKIKD